MSPVYDVTNDEAREEHLSAAATAVSEGKLVILPTDTVYGVGADPFNAAAIEALLSAKGRGRDKPSAVLIAKLETVDGLAMNVPSYARHLMEKFWPGGLTLIFRAQPSLMWDLGDTNGTVGLRIPDDEIARGLLKKTGPLAVSSANQTGQPTATTITEAGFAFGPAVEAYLDGGVRAGGTPSTIIDCTKPDPVMLREGALSAETIQAELGPVKLVDSTKGPLAEVPAAQKYDEQGQIIDSSSAEAVTNGETSGVGAEAPTSSEAGGGAEASNSPGVGAEAAPTSPENPGAEKTANPTSDASHEAAAEIPGSDFQVPSLADTPALSQPSEPSRGRMPELAHEDETTIMPIGGVGAEPPFERDPIPNVELPSRDGDVTH